MGFYVALTELLRLKLTGAQEDQTAVTLRLIEEETTPKGGSSGQEKRDYLIGRVSAYSSLIHSEALLSLPEPSDFFSKTVTALCTVAKSTSWLREESGLTLCQTIRIVAQNKRPAVYAEEVIKALVAADLARTPQGVAVWLEVTRLVPRVALPRSIWHKQDPLAKKELASLGVVMKQNSVPSAESSDSASTTAQSGARQQAPSFAWDIVLSALVSKSEGGEDGTNSKGSKSSIFSQFWTEIVDSMYSNVMEIYTILTCIDGFFAPSASVERKSLGFQVLSKVIEHLPAWTLTYAFSPKLKGSLINQSAKSDRYLHGVARAMLDAVVLRAKRDGEAAAAIIDALVFSNGNGKFDESTGTKTVRSILSSIDETTFSNVAEQYLLNVKQPKLKSTTDATEKLSETEIARHTYVGHLLNAIKDRILDKDAAQEVPAWLKSIAMTFAKYGYEEGFATTKTSTELFSTRLNSLLAHVLRMQPEVGTLVAVAVADYLSNLDQHKTEVGKQADSHAWNVLQQARDTLAALAVQVKATHKSIEAKINIQHKSSSSSKVAVASTLRLMLSMAIVAAFGGDVDSFSILDELQDCYTMIFETKKASASDSSSGQAFDMIIEIVLSSASKGSSLYRTISEQVFEAFASELSAEALQSMLDVLNQSENMSGQQALFDAHGEVNDEEDDEDTEQDSDEEEKADGRASIVLDSSDDDVEMIEAEDKDDTSDSDDAEESGEENEEEDDELQRFDKLLAETLQTSIPNGTDKDEDNESSDEDMDDDEMMALEPSLTKIFQQRKEASGSSKTREKKDAKQNMLNFKNRVLDLLLIYIKQQHDNRLGLELILPLLQLMRTTTSKQISEKTFGLLKRYFDTSKAKGMPKHVDLVEVSSKMVTVHTEALKFASKMHAAACSRASLFLARVLLDAEEANLDAIIDLYSETQKRCMAGRSKLTSSFWTEWINWSFSVVRKA